MDLFSKCEAPTGTTVGLLFIFSYIKADQTLKTCKSYSNILRPYLKLQILKHPKNVQKQRGTMRRFSLARAWTVFFRGFDLAMGQNQTGTVLRM